MAIWMTPYKVFGLLLFFTVLNLYVLKLCWDSPGQSCSDAITQMDTKHDFWHLTVLVMTAPKNLDRRRIVRETWKSEMLKTGLRVRVLFVLGQYGLTRETINMLHEEKKEYDDMLIIESLQDSYFNLTQKLLMTLQWLVEAGQGVTFTMKCDDDTFIDGKRLLSQFDSLPHSNLYYGYFSGAARVKKSGPWAEPNYHLCDRYLPYARGGGYVITWDLVQYIVRNRDLLQVYNSEDVSLGVWLAPLDIDRHHDVSFDTEASSRGCQNHHVVSHKQSIDDMLAKHQSLTQSGRLCDKERVVKSEYVYNWDVLPSQCCVPKGNQ